MRQLYDFILLANFISACLCSSVINAQNIQQDTSLPNLTPYRPSGWSDKIEVSNVAGAKIDTSIIYSNEDVYVNCSVINNGNAPISLTFCTKLFVDDVEKDSWSITPPMDVGEFRCFYLNIKILSAGTHTLKIITDFYNDIKESNESDNQYTKTITIRQAPSNELDKQYPKKRSITQSYNYYPKKRSITHSTEKRFFSGIGGHLGFTESNNTGIIVNTSFVTSSGTGPSSTTDLTTDGFEYGVYLNLLEYYFDDRFSIGLSSFFVWTGTPTPKDIEGLNKSGGTFFIASAFMLNYGFVISETTHHPQYYFGIGPTLIHATQMKASATLTQDMSKEEMFAKYSSVYGIAFELGDKFMGEDGGYKLAVRIGIPFSDMAINELSITKNGSSLALNKNDMSTFSAAYCMLFFSIDIGWL